MGDQTFDLAIAPPPLYYTTRNVLTFANTIAIAYCQNLAALVNPSPLCNTVAVVFANVRELRVSYTALVFEVSPGLFLACLLAVLV